MRIVALGPPGTGKGTYATMICKKYSLLHISTGDLLREEKKSGSELGNKIGELIDSGHFVPDEMITELLKKRISQPDAENGFLLDGYPRNIAQAEALEGITEIDHVLNFQATKETILERLGGRITCKACSAIFHEKFIKPVEEGKCDKCGDDLYKREDQAPEIIKKRLEVYEEQTAPMIEHYRVKGTIHDINANLPIERVDEIMAEVDEALGQ